MIFERVKAPWVEIFSFRDDKVGLAISFSSTFFLNNRAWIKFIDVGFMLRFRLALGPSSLYSDWSNNNQAKDCTNLVMQLCAMKLSEELRCHVSKAERGSNGLPRSWIMSKNAGRQPSWLTVLGQKTLVLAQRPCRVDSQVRDTNYEESALKTRYVKVSR